MRTLLTSHTSLEFRIDRLDTVVRLYMDKLEPRLRGPNFTVLAGGFEQLVQMFMNEPNAISADPENDVAVALSVTNLQ